MGYPMCNDMSQSGKPCFLFADIRQVRHKKAMDTGRLCKTPTRPQIILELTYHRDVSFVICQ